MLETQNETTLNKNISRQLIWRRNAPYFYQSLFTTSLEWPSLAVEWWYPPNAYSTQQIKDDELTMCQLVYGTHTSNEEKNYLVFAKIYVPNQNYLKKMYKDKPFKPSDAIRKNEENMQQKIIVQHEIQHEGEVNRIRHHPTMTNLIATRTPLGQIHIFDKLKFKAGKNKISPSIVLAGHQTQGYSIQWNKNKEGHIIAGSYDGKLSLWDINHKYEGRKMYPLCDFSFHDSEIEEVSYNLYHDSIFASCDDEGYAVFWDTRNSKGPFHNFKAHEASISSIQFAPLNQYLLATAGADSLTKIWDIRNLSSNIFELKQEDGKAVSQLKWTPDDKNLLWTVAQNTMTMWSVFQQIPKFVHAGHMQKINQMDIHEFQAETIVSVDNSNDIQVFQPTRNCRL